MRRLLRPAVAAVVLVLAGLTGCTPFSPGFYPFSMGIWTPIPVPPWVSTRIEDRYQNTNDYRAVIMPPVRPGFPEPLCEDPPDDAAVLRAMPAVKRGVPYVCEEFRDNIQIVTERTMDKIDPPRPFPLVGWARLHHCHYKCTVYYIETRQSDYPFPYKVVKPRVEVVYIDKDHLHLEPGGAPEVQQQVTRDLIGQ